MDRKAWHAAVHAVAKSRTWLSDWTELNTVGLTVTTRILKKEEARRENQRNGNMKKTQANVPDLESEESAHKPRKVEKIP